MSETTLTELEQREIRMYIRDSVGGADIDTDRLPRWLAHLVEAERERDQLRAERDALKEELEKAQGARQWIDPAERLPEDGVEVLVCLYWGGWQLPNTPRPCRNGKRQVGTTFTARCIGR